MVMVFPVTVENAVDTGVGTHVDILSLGHLRLPSRILRPIITEIGSQRNSSQKGKETERDY